MEKTPEEYVARLVEIFREVRRVLRADGTCWINLGDSYSNAGTRQRDRDGEVSDRINEHRHFYRPNAPGLKPKDLCGIPWRVSFALQADGWYLRSDIIWSKPNPMPESVTDRPTKSHEYLFLLSKSERYYYDADAIKEPAITPQQFGKAAIVASGKRREMDDPLLRQNGSETNWTLGRNRRSVWTIATEPYPEAHFATFPRDLVRPCILAGTSARGCCPKCGAGWERITETNRVKDPHRHTGRAATGCGDRNDGAEARMLSNQITLGWRPSCECDGKLVKRQTWMDFGAGREYKSFLHFEGIASEPVPPVVLDPFAGSGTTLEVARELQCDGIGVELSAAYCELAKERIGRQEILPLAPMDYAEPGPEQMTLEETC